MNEVNIKSTDDLIHYLVNSKKELIKEIKSDYLKPEFQEALSQLRKINSEILNRANTSNQDYLNGNFKSQDDLEIESNKW